MATSFAVVGFRKDSVDLERDLGYRTPEQAAHDILIRAPERSDPRVDTLLREIKVVRKIRHINAVIVQVDAGREEEFLRVAPNLRPVEYCDEDVSLEVSSFPGTVAPPYSPGTDLANVIRDYHVDDPDSASALGLGVRIGILDTGIAPHPYLPSLSSTELAAKVHCFHPSISDDSRDAIIDHVRQCELSARAEAVGLLPASTATQARLAGANSAEDRLAVELSKAMDDYVASTWRNWKAAVRLWLKNRRATPKPGLPSYGNFYGPFRLISPFSRNFVDGSPDQGILDTHGHGTFIAGVLAALPPSKAGLSMRELLSEETFDQFSVGVVGLCPYADITVLRCADPSIEGGTYYRHMLYGLEYCVDLNLDALYIGLTYKGDRHPIAVSNLLDLLERNGTVVFAPAGNYERPNSAGLVFPASSNSVHAVTSVVQGSNSGGLEFCDYSAIADKTLHERVSFCAYGGDAQSRVISTSKNLGFLGDSGTSVAAAIAAACYANAASSLFVRRITHEYETLFPIVGQVCLDHIEYEMRKWSLHSSERHALMQVMQKSAGAVPGLTTEQCGSGLVKIPRKDALP